MRGRRAPIVALPTVALPTVALLTVALLAVVSVAAAAFVTLRLREGAVAQRFEAATARLPSNVYARPLVLHLGMDPDHFGVAEHLDRAGYRVVAGPAVAEGEFAMLSDQWRIGRRPSSPSSGSGEPGGLLVVELDPDGRIEALRGERGELLERVHLEPPRIGAFGQRELGERLPVALDELPASLVDAVLVTEDRGFFEHGAFDFRRILGAAIANLRAGRVVQGASTITQQLAKSLYLSSERTWSRKSRELWLAWRLEQALDKQAILEAYLNEIYLGQRGSDEIRGVGSAAQHYLGKDVRRIDLAESALLAGLIRSPSRASPLRDPQRARARRDLVLRQLLETGAIGEPAYRDALAAPLPAPPMSAEIASKAYFVDYLRRELERELGAERLEAGGLEIHTSLDLRLQAIAERAVRRQLARIETLRPGLVDEASPVQAAVVVLEPNSGQILALVGGRDHPRFPFDRATQARRQPASSFKPVVMLAALARLGDEAPPFTLASVLSDQPLRLEIDGALWSPRNHDLRYRGSVTLREAIEHSLNVPIARLGAAIGWARVVTTARRMGIESPLSPLPSLSLGTFELSLLELTRAFAVLAADGIRAPLRAARRVLGPDGQPIERELPPALRNFAAAETFLVSSALQGTIDRGTATTVRQLGYRGAIAGKTGSSDEFRDAWFVGYTPDVVVGVWVGFDTNRPLGLNGSAAAVPLAAELLVAIVGERGGAAIRPPPGVERVALTVLENGRCRRLDEYFLVGTAPPPACDPDAVPPPAPGGSSAHSNDAAQ